MGWEPFKVDYTGFPNSEMPTINFFEMRYYPRTVLLSHYYDYGVGLFMPVVDLSTC
jgi:hypothetical protein